MKRLLFVLLVTFMCHGLVLAQSSSDRSKPDGILNEYRARLSEKDHNDGHGRRLDTVAQIIRRDRVYFHLLHQPDDEDDDDKYFDTSEHRDRLEQLVESANLSKYSIDKIVNSTPMIRVQIRREGGVIKISIRVF